MFITMLSNFCNLVRLGLSAVASYISFRNLNEVCVSEYGIDFEADAFHLLQQLFKIVCFLSYMIVGFENLLSATFKISSVGKWISWTERKLAIAILESETSFLGQEYLLKSKLAILKKQCREQRFVGFAELFLGHALLLSWAMDARFIDQAYINLYPCGISVYLSFSLWIMWNSLQTDLATLSHRQTAVSAVAAHVAKGESRPGDKTSWFQLASPQRTIDDINEKPQYHFFCALASVLDVSVGATTGTVTFDSLSDNFSEESGLAALRSLCFDMTSCELALLAPQMDKPDWASKYMNDVSTITSRLRYVSMMWLVNLLAILCYLPCLLDFFGVNVYILLPPSNIHSWGGSQWYHYKKVLFILGESFLFLEALIAFSRVPFALMMLEGLRSIFNFRLTSSEHQLKLLLNGDTSRNSPLRRPTNQHRGDAPNHRRDGIINDEHGLYGLKFSYVTKKKKLL